MPKTQESIAAYNKEYSSRPEVIEWAKIRNARPERKAVRKLYKTTEAGRRANNKYRAKLEIKEKYKNYRLKVRYGITTIEYLEMVENQKGICAICSKSDGQDLHVDHSHETGKVRELLCGSCNRALGLFKDDSSILVKALEYIKKHK